VLALVVGDRLDLRRCLGEVEALLVSLELHDHVADRVRAEEPGHEEDRADPQAGATGVRHRRAEVAQLARPDVGVASLVRRDQAERLGPPGVLLDLRQAVVQGDGVALQLEVLEAVRGVDRWHRPES
jgi:hypothetical protein